MAFKSHLDLSYPSSSGCVLKVQVWRAKESASFKGNDASYLAVALWSTRDSSRGISFYRKAPGHRLRASTSACRHLQRIHGGTAATTRPRAENRLSADSYRCRLQRHNKKSDGVKIGVETATLTVISARSRRSHADLSISLQRY